MIIPYIYEEDSDADAADLTHISIPDISPMPSVAPSVAPSSTGLSDTDEDVLDLGVGASLAHRKSWKTRQVQSHMKNDSISSIELRDLPALREDELDLGPVPPIPSPLHSLTEDYPHLRPNASHHWTRPATAVLNKDLPPLPGDDSDDVSPTYSDFPSPPTPTPAPRSGATSPDIAAIIASTPRHKRHSSSGSHSTRRRSRSTKRGSGGTLAVPPLEGLGARQRSDLAYTRRRSHDDEEEEEDYGEVIDRTGTVMDWRMLDKEVEARLERELEGFGSDEDDSGNGSDSSIDVQTPLP